MNMMPLNKIIDKANKAAGDKPLITIKVTADTVVIDFNVWKITGIIFTFASVTINFPINLLSILWDVIL